MHWFRWDGADLLLNVKIQPGASRNEFSGLHGAALRVRIHAPAVEGQANEALIVFLSRSFATSKRCITIERGTLSRTKSLRIQVPSQLPAELVLLGLTTATQ